MKVKLVSGCGYLVKDGYRECNFVLSPGDHEFADGFDVIQVDGEAALSSVTVPFRPVVHVKSELELLKDELSLLKADVDVLKSKVK